MLTSYARSLLYTMCQVYHQNLWKSPSSIPSSSGSSLLFFACSSIFRLAQQRLAKRLLVFLCRTKMTNTTKPWRQWMMSDTMKASCSKNIENISKHQTTAMNAKSLRYMMKLKKIWADLFSFEIIGSLTDPFQHPVSCSRLNFHL